MLCTIFINLLALATGAGVSVAGELSGFVLAELRGFPTTAAFPEQNDLSLQPSLALQPEYRLEWSEARDRLTIVPFLRLDAIDDERTHVDLRELNWLHLRSNWDVLVGIGKVFWGVAESRHLVDIINQTDLVENIDGEDKLGQPMINVNLIRNWGRVSLFALPGFRQRTFPGRKGRLRTEPYVDADHDDVDEWRVDAAVRWGHAIGDVDIGIAHFWGMGREPRLIPEVDALGRPTVLKPHYDIIHQTSVELQATLGNWLLKLEAITRSGQGRRFAALVAGFEYTLFGVFDTPIDLGLLAEYLYDGRDRHAPLTPFDNDLFLGLRLALNDPQSTELLAGVIVDLDNQGQLFSIEANRRFGERWRLELEVRIFNDMASSDVLFNLRRDDLVQLSLARFF